MFGFGDGWMDGCRVTKVENRFVLLLEDIGSRSIFFNWEECQVLCMYHRKSDGDDEDHHGSQGSPAQCLNLDIF